MWANFGNFWTEEMLPVARRQEFSKAISMKMLVSHADVLALEMSLNDQFA